MKLLYDMDADTITLQITPDEPHGFKWNEGRTYAQAHDPVRGRVGAVLLPHPTKKPLRVERLRGEVVVVIRYSPYNNTVRLDAYVSIDIGERGIVTAVRVAQ